MEHYMGFKSLITIATIIVSSMSSHNAREERALWSWLQTDQSEAAQAYREGREAIDDGKWDAAIEAFERAAELDATREDAALYWIAYSQNKKGDQIQAIETLRKLQRTYPQSRWIREAKALEMEIQGPSKEAADEDMEIKLMALNSLMQADEDEAVPLLEEVLKSDQPTKLKERALFVLAQSGSSRAFEVVSQIARNNADPELQEKAIKYIGIHGRRENIALLSELYDTVASVDTKKAILHSFMVADQQERLLQAATGEDDPELRGAAIHWLGVMDAEDELWSLYEKEASLEMKKKILHALFIGDGSDKLLVVAQNRAEPEELRLQAIHWLGVSDRDDVLWTIFQNEPSLEVRKRILHGLFLSDSVDKLAQVARDGSQPVELRKAAIHNLGITDEGSRPLLLEIYSSESDFELRKQVLHALFLQDAATELIDIAKRETDRELKKQAVHWLSLTDTPEARQFLLELIKK
jgi:outer membrane protein assembly factor BamD (BamD/ComL family)